MGDQERPQHLSELFELMLQERFPGVPPGGVFAELADDLVEAAHHWSPPDRERTSAPTRCYGCSEIRPGDDPAGPRDFTIELRVIRHVPTSMMDAAELQGEVIGLVVSRGWEWAHGRLGDHRGTSGYLVPDPEPVPAPEG